jgi:hypothetical protein
MPAQTVPAQPFRGFGDVVQPLIGFFNQTGGVAAVGVGAFTGLDFGEIVCAII